jgi:lysine 6-dehydrogenase
MRASVLGCGAVGSRAARMLAEAGLEVVAVDANPSALASVERAEGVEAVVEDLSSPQALRRFMSGFDVACDCLPSRLGFKVMRAAVEEGARLVSVSYVAEDPLTLNEEAERSGALIIPDCGLAPGLSNVLAGRAYAELKELGELHVRVGAIPSTPKPPLRHAATWNLADLLDEYVRPARIIRGGRVVKVDPLSTVVHVWVGGVGLLEGFFSDGLRTMLKTIKAREMDELTLRHRGHLASMKALAELGLLSGTAGPRRLLEDLLREAWRGFIDDLLILEVEAVGVEGGRSLSRLVSMDAVDPPLLKATAAACSTAALMAARGELSGGGVHPPELIGMSEAAYASFIKGLEGKGLKVERSQLS